LRRFWRWVWVVVRASRSRKSPALKVVVL
jgi:hypothetical protein